MYFRLVVPFYLMLLQAVAPSRLQAGYSFYSSGVLVMFD
jgi:hypothetical protein